MKNVFVIDKVIKKKLPEGLFDGTSDIHAHIMPCIDDGVQSMCETVDVIRRFEAAGIKRMIMTPHFTVGYSHNRKPAVTAEFFHLNRTIMQTKTKMKLDVAAEYVIDDGFMSHKNDGFMTLGKSNYVLMETSVKTPENFFHDGLMQVCSDGKIPVLAHPEFHKFNDVDLFLLHLKTGCLFQLNILSLSGYYGLSVKKKALHLLDNDIYTFVASDIHNLKVFLNWISRIRLNTEQIDRLRILLENNNTVFK